MYNMMVYSLDLNGINFFFFNFCIGTEILIIFLALFSQGNFGACFIPGLCKTSDAQLFAVRPGMRVWLSDTQGSVLNTHIFKDSLIAGGVPEIPILAPSRGVGAASAEQQFSRIFIFQVWEIENCNFIFGF